MSDCYLEDCGKVDLQGVMMDYRTECYFLWSLTWLLEILDETAISDYDTWTLYDNKYPVIYLNKYTITHPVCLY